MLNMARMNAYLDILGLSIGVNHNTGNVFMQRLSFVFCYLLHFWRSFFIWTSFSPKDSETGRPQPLCDRHR